MKAISDYIQEWEINAKTTRYKNHVRESIECIKECKKIGVLFSISWSGGKDSTAVAHLVKSIWPEVPIISQFDDCDWADKEPYMTQVAKKFGWEIIKAVPDFSVWEMARQYKIGVEHVCAGSHDMTKLAFFDPLNKKQKEHGAGGIFMGLRAEESRMREMNYYKRGMLYQLKSGEWRCNPIVRLLVDDVFSYLITNDVGINPCYLKNRFFPPQRIRLSWAFPTPSGVSKGEMRHIKYYYPQHYQRLQELNIQ